MDQEPRSEPPPAGVAPWEPRAYYGTFAAVVAAMVLRQVQADTHHSSGVRVLVSVLMLVLSVLIVTESVFVLFNVRSALWKISGRPADQQLKLGSERKPWDGFSPRMWCWIFLLAGLFCLGYAIHGL